jgi:D-3-phosphoglycerate dehydrogenase
MTRILVTDPIAEEGLNVLRARADVDVRLGLNELQLCDVIGDYQALVVRSETKVTDTVLAAAPCLQVVGRAGVGVDNIDVAAATRRGMLVVNVPAGNTIAAAEHTIAMLLALARNIPQADASMRRGVWARNEFVGVEVRGKTLGIIGLGRVGREVGRRAEGLQMRLLGYDPFLPTGDGATHGIDLVELDQLLSQSDFVSLHIPLTESTRSLMSASRMSNMKRGARLINCARGGIVEEQALFDAVESGHLAGAAVDVFEEEPAPHSLLARSSKIVVTPHLGASTVEAQVAVAVEVAEQVLAVLAGDSPRYAVNAPTFPMESAAVLQPFLPLAEKLGYLATMLSEGQLQAIRIRYEGDVAQHDITPLRAAVTKGLLEPVSEARVSIVNAYLISRERGLRIQDHRDTARVEPYLNLLTVRLETNVGCTEVSGTLVHDEPRIVRINGFWVDVQPNGGFWLFGRHEDRPGMIGAIGTLLGKHNVNISFMQVGRFEVRGQALLVLGVDDPISTDLHQQLLALPHIQSLKIVCL